MGPYSKLLDLHLFGAYYSLKGRKYGDHRRLLEHSQWWPAERMQEFQWQELKALLRYSFDRIPYYHNKYAGISLEDIRTLEDFRRLPTLERAEVNDHREQLRDPHARENLILHATGGSSGTPTRFYMTTDSFDWRLAATARAYSFSGYRVGDRALFLWGAPATELSGFKAAKLAAYHSLRRELVFNTFKQDERLWEAVLRQARRFRPRFVVGYVSSLESFAEYLVFHKQQISGIEGVLSAAEPVTQRTRSLVRAAFCAPLFNAYGSREFMSIAAECEQHDGLHINAENILVETENDNPDQPAELLITDLHNFGTPLIRYRIGDAGKLASAPCACGRGLPRIQAIEGRLTDLFRLHDGRVVSGLVFPHVLKEFPNIAEFQVEQRDVDSIVLRVVLRSPLTADDVAGLNREFTRILGGTITMQIQPVDSIPRLPSGKRRIAVGLPRS